MINLLELVHRQEQAVFKVCLAITVSDKLVPQNIKEAGIGILRRAEHDGVSFA
jgi:hypothetical protein